MNIFATINYFISVKQRSQSHICKLASSRFMGSLTSPCCLAVFVVVVTSTPPRLPLVERSPVSRHLRSSALWDSIRRSAAFRVFFHTHFLPSDFNDFKRAAAMRGDETDSESVKSDDGSVRRSLDALCQELNMDEETATEALQNFTSICNTYTLEVTLYVSLLHIITA